MQIILMLDVPASHRSHSLQGTPLPTKPDRGNMKAAAKALLLLGALALSTLGPAAGSNLEQSLVDEAEGLFSYMQEIRR